MNTTVRNTNRGRGMLRLLQGIVLVLFCSVTIPAQSAMCLRYFQKHSGQEVGPRQFSPAIQQVQELKIVTYNMLNLYMHLGKYHQNNSIHMTQKPRWALDQMAELFEKHPFDIMVAQEVESVQSAREFNKEFLKNKFRVMTTTTKDARGLYTVFFIRKTLPFEYRMDSHLNEKWKDPMDGDMKEVFPRDIPTLHLLDPADKSVPLMTLIGAHFKSMRHRDISVGDGTYNRDFESRVQREAQVNRATQIIQRYQLTYGFKHPIVIMGDFNNSHNFQPEFMGFFRHTKLRDSLSLMEELGYLDRVSHSYFGNGRAQHHQLDGILIVPSLIEAMSSSYVIPYYDQNGNPKPLPYNKNDRKSNPSDHWPILAVFDFQKIISQLD